MEIEVRFRGRTACLFLLAAACVSGAYPAEQRTFILEKADRGLLCAYTSEREWAQVPKDKDIEFTARVDSGDGVVTAVLVERFTEDTTMYDEYTVARDGNVLRLKRTLDVIPERVTREQVWNIRGGWPVKVSESWMESRTHKPRGPDEDLGDRVANPIMVRISDFPFYSLMTDKHPARWPGGTRCVSGDMNKLEAIPAK